MLVLSLRAETDDRLLSVGKCHPAVHYVEHAEGLPADNSIILEITHGPVELIECFFILAFFRKNYDTNMI